MFVRHPAQLGRAPAVSSSPVLPECIYATAWTVAPLAGVPVAALERWIAAGRLACVVTVEPHHPRKIIRLYRLSDVLQLKAASE